jgi:hypothetical protein
VENDVFATPLFDHPDWSTEWELQNEEITEGR